MNSDNLLIASGGAAALLSWGIRVIYFISFALKISFELIVSWDTPASANIAD
jgi:hypothetical protein